jgi:hypothetical protein
MLLLAAGLSLAAMSARADVTRCTGADGVAAYTDRGCDALGAQPSAMPASLLRTLARDAGESTSPVAAGSNVAGSNVELGELRPLDGSATGSMPHSYAGCPRTPDQLQAAFQESVAIGDVNQLAAIYDWTDVSSRQSRDLLRRLERLSRTHAQDASYAASGMRRRAGCLLLSL